MSLQTLAPSSRTYVCGFAEMNNSFKLSRYERYIITSVLCIRTVLIAFKLRKEITIIAIHDAPTNNPTRVLTETSCGVSINAHFTKPRSNCSLPVGESFGCGTGRISSFLDIGFSWLSSNVPRHIPTTTSIKTTA